MLWSIDDPREDGLVAVEFPYFEQPEPLEWDDDVTYVDIGDHKIEHGRTQEWNHGLAETITALMAPRDDADLDRGARLGALGVPRRPVRRAPRPPRRVPAAGPARRGSRRRTRSRLSRPAEPAGVRWAGCALAGRCRVRLNRPMIRIGIDTGGTFTDVVAFDEATGAITTTKTPSTPQRPGRRVHGRHREGPGPRRRRRTTTSRPSRTAPRSRPTSCSRARSTRSATSPTSATRRCSRSPASRCPTATATRTSGSKPPRIVPRHLVRGVEGRLDFTGARGASLRRGAGAGRGPVVPRRGHRHARGLLPARLRQPRPRGADARDPARGAPRRGGVDQQRGAAGVPRVRTRDDHPGRRGRQAAAEPLRHQHPGPPRRRESGRATCRST